MSILKGPWSYSRAVACARALYKEKVEKAPPEPRPQALLSIDRRALGSILHEGCEILLKGSGNRPIDPIEGMMSGPWPDPSVVTEALLKMEIDGVRPYFHLMPEGLLIAERLELFVARFRRDWDMDLADRDARIRDNMLGSEMRLAFDGHGKRCEFTGCPEDGWRGIVDYAEVDDDTLIVIDFKNRPAIFSEAELRADEQLSGYAQMVVADNPGVFKKVRYGIYYLEFGHLQLIDADLETMARNVNRLRRRARVKEQLRAEEIGPEPGFGKCQYCDWISTCDAGRELVQGHGFIASDADQARELASWLMVTEEKVKAAKEALKAYTGEFGAIEVDDKTRIGHCASLDGVDYDKDLTLRILKKLIDEGTVVGPLHRFTGLKTADVKKAAKDPEVYEALAPARSPKASSTFKFFRPTTAKEVKKKTEKKTRARVRAGDRK